MSDYKEERGVDESKGRGDERKRQSEMLRAQGREPISGQKGPFSLHYLIHKPSTLCLKTAVGYAMQRVHATDCDPSPRTTLWSVHLCRVDVWGCSVSRLKEALHC